MNRFMTSLGVACALLTSACGEKESQGKGPSGGATSSDGRYYGKIVLTAATPTALTAADGDCGFSMDIYRGEGYCLTPMTMAGWASKVDLLNDVMGRPGTRILSESEDTAKKGAIVSGAGFDFAAANGSSLVGNNTLFDEYDIKGDYEGVAVRVFYLKAQFALKDQFVTVLLPSYSQPFDKKAQELCGFGEDIAQQERYQDVNLLDGLEFERGDFLFCVKSTADASCEASDYKWYDTGTSALVGTRPASPKTSKYLAGSPVKCDGAGEGRYDFNFGDFGFVASIPSGKRFKLYSDFSYGSMSKQWTSATSPLGDAALEGESPYTIYYYEGPDGKKVEGTNMVLDIAFDSSQSAFLEGIRTSDVAGSPLESLLGKLQFKSQWAFDKKFTDGVSGGFTSHYAGMSATVDVNLTGGTEPPKDASEL
jgi:hypothetical protein